MTAIINSRPSTSLANTPGLNPDAKPVLLGKIEGHVARVNDIILLTREDGVWTCSDDRSVRLYLKRDNGQYWPSIHHFMPVAPTCMYYSEEQQRLLVGLLNGHVYEYKVAEDNNSLSEVRRWTIHAGPISGLALAIAAEQVFSCSKDKTIVWHCSETAVKLGGFGIDSSCTCMTMDLPFVFIGDHGGNVHVLRLNGNLATLVSKLSAHTGTITSLAWDASAQWLFSGSADNLVIMWDIGGNKGQAYELNGHQSRVSRLAIASAARKLFSADDGGKMVCWDLKANRIETPAWQNNDNCQICDSPFFWNVQAMWQRKVVGNRQHHCRTCGKAVCATCCQARTTYPPMGFELPVRICKNCDGKMKDQPQNYDLTPLAIVSDIRSGVTGMHMQELSGKIVAVGVNRIVMIWDVQPMF